jgi:hypothetical protein
MPVVVEYWNVYDLVLKTLARYSVFHFDYSSEKAVSAIPVGLKCETRYNRSYR